ncbi:hypothetical protein ABPG75_008406 [Micractinium tetrahymenae]
MPTVRMLAPLLAALLLAAGPRGAASIAGDSFLCDLVTASASPMNQGTYKDTKGGYGTVSIIDNGAAYSWEVDIFQADLPASIQLVLTTPGLPQLIQLTNKPSSDGISFGSLDYDQVAQAVAASANPNAKLSDGTLGVVATFAKPAGSALLCPLIDGTEIFHAVYAPPSPPATTPPAPNVYALHPGVDPEIYYSQLDGTQVYILESGLLNPGNGTASILIYDWKDGTFSWELETNNVANPQGLQLKVFNDLVDQPFVMNLTADQSWAPETLSYTGNFTLAQLQAGLAAAGRPDAYLSNHTPDLFLEMIDLGGVTQEEIVLEQQASAPAPSVTPLGTVANVRRRLAQAAGAAPAPAGDVLGAPAPGPDGAPDGAAGTCTEKPVPSRIIGFIFDSVSRYKLKPVLKDTSSIPSSVKEIPLFISAGFLAACLIVFVSMYISGTLEAASA